MVVVMKTVAYAAAAAVMVAGTASAQSAPSSDLTRMLNGAPPSAIPRATTPPATRPATAAPAPNANRLGTPATTTSPRTTPSTTTPAARPSATGPAAVMPPRATPTPPGSASAARSSPTTPVTTTPPRTAPPPASAAPASPPPAPPTVLNAAAVAALPFTVDLPSTFQITTGRPGPNFNVYAIRKGGRSFVTVYVGPASQFPIYTGETVQLSGRSSIVVAEDGRRRAVEHLFRRENPALEIHAWVASLEGADRNQAEQIAQSISPR